VPALVPALVRAPAMTPVMALALALALTPTGPAAAQPAPPALAWVTNQGSDDVSVLALTPGEPVREIARVPACHAPAGVVAVAARERVWVSCPDDGRLAEIDMRSRQRLALWPGGQGPLGLDASADGRWLHVVDWYGRQLRSHDLDRPAEPPRLTPLGHAPAGVAADAGATAWVSERDDDRVALIDAAQGRVLARVAVGRHPFALLRDPQRPRLYVLNVESDDLSVIDTTRREVIATLPTGRAPYGAALADDGRLLYVTNQHDDSVSVFDAQRLQPLRRLDGFGYPEGIATWGDAVHVVEWMDERVSVLDARSGAPRQRVATGRNSRGFGAFIAARPDAPLVPEARPPRADPPTAAACPAAAATC
jgi:YVTN family beta-propeller protein